ncbi:D-alanyl-D-alanine carboxypeptidase family protein [Tahibacter amnicola]|uniref:serine-type D-Ala-D-Ala carboxypeptidase n=1 Tax=Tahibacter amnicola TaxID=2976241 RepID=A0ABY6BDV6_9GAMM|nr:D-alanyl-D-alanine carboxypeptidase family protein [Tahibacter amnicola]UXI67997.1 D-alanyl-D-alanine carboxypeptidase [Tahibacter amnicola]
MSFTRHLLAAFVITLAGHASAQAPAPAATPTATATPRPAVPTALNVPVPPPPTLDATAWVLMDYATGQVLASANPDQRVEPASITKIMTSYVVSAELAAGKVKPTDEVHISENSWRGGGGGTDGSTSFLGVGTKVKLHDVLLGMIVQSGNDAAIALAEHVAGSEAVFAQLMNQYAQRLGLKDTHFVNASGLSSPEHYTTARDVATLSRALIRDFPEDYKIYAMKEFEWNGIKQHNRNTLLWRDASVDGIKTGHHSTAGFCLAASAKRGEERLITVIMGTKGEKARADMTQELLNYGFRFYESHQLYAAARPIAEPTLWKGESNTIKLGVAEDVTVTLPRGRYGDLKAAMDVPGRFVAPFTKGQKLGTLKITLDGNVLTERPIIAMEEYGEGGFFKRLGDGVMLWFKSDEAVQPSAQPDTK